MSTLGEILTQLQNRAEVYALLVEAGELQVMADLNLAAAATSQDPCDVALDAVRSFTEKADEEAWVRLMGRLQGAQSPGATCLADIIAWSLAK